LIVTDYALDCKCRFDDSSFYRQKELFAFKDITQLDPNEVEAEHHGLNYVTMDGNIGCMVNGAGLAMATMDIINVYGGWPANFLDVSGNATPETVREGFKILSRDPNVIIDWIDRNLIRLIDANYSSGRSYLSEHLWWHNQMRHNRTRHY